DKNSGLTVELLNFRPIDRPDDTIKAVEMMKNLDISCLIVLGGDGTCRLVAKTDIDVPIIPVSTGTNNVYPQFYEGTTVGIAASYISLNRGNYDLDRSKRIEVYINGKFSDIALVDAVITDLPYVGSKVVSETQNIKELIVSMCSPVSVGFSSIAGNITICNEDHDFGYRIKFDDFGIKIFAPVSPGNVEEVSFSELERMDIDYEYFSLPNYDGTIALDGERTISFRYGDQLKFRITRKGPYKVDILKILSRAVENKFFHLNT
ncbi:MAG TPA: ATP-NAD kinase, partial [Tissierellia bacterium]|nr:ATP-NAD kinase [Tissierellia bacterium]